MAEINKKLWIYKDVRKVFLAVKDMTHLAYSIGRYQGD